MSGDARMAGASMPTALVHLAFLAVAVVSFVVVLDTGFWTGVGVLLAVAATLVPDRVPAWWLILLLAMSQLWREPSATDAAFYLLLAGVGLLHVLGSLVRVLPRRGRVETAALVPPLRRFVLVQAFVQPVAFGALATFAHGTGTVQHLSVVAASALGVVAVVLGRGVRRNAERAER